MSGRWLTILAVTGCVALVAFALWQRARTTQHVRDFWGAAQANVIQHGPNVRLRASSGDENWQDLSTAPGLVHLRATLVDDRYFQWAALQPAAPPATTAYLLQFSRDEQIVELAIEPSSGQVTNLQSQQCVPLIPASRQAVAAYLQQIAPR